MVVIKSVLQEELENSLRMKKEYEKAFKANPGGCIVQKMKNLSFSIGIMIL